ncbi:hypothetical protein J3R30DRAFT_3729702 [Lentinula aciculospora]|uniref:Uncharacterized protein n=1 Tax=Lentinula aciculospora TaxID=153920 RepID=A0A9W9ASQ4_9AGAR|nr:hypothetical protein J3R30DRAFT_3734065 [Lentinula aciculospora]KAJ4487619.1 hypothetical protein J3R30DRAFT_3729702 [Lentinula aciculospora]
MASTSVAATSAARSAAFAASSTGTVPQPSSPFASLLRRSRFATFDPRIRQTYYTPPAHASRGSWGLKRPLALRRRNAFITLPAPFEDRAQFIEWSKAEDEVRFIRRFEEMQVRPRVKLKTPWAKTLGSKNLTNWIIDSEFCYRYEGPEAEEEGFGSNENLLQMQARQAEQERLEEQQRSVSDDLAEFGKAGQGNYGHRRALKHQAVRLSPNIEAMMPDQFERYVRRLRQLRPKFKEFLQKVAVEDTRVLEGMKEELVELEKTAVKDRSVRPQVAKRNGAIETIQKTSINPNKSLFEIAQNPSVEYHRRFIEDYTASQFADISNSNGVLIEQRPHQVGGLLYSHPSHLHTQLFATPQPGIILQNALERVNHGDETIFVGSFGGLTPVIRQENRGDKIPLLNHNSLQGIQRENIRRSVAKMRMVPGSVVVEQPPLSVARNSSGLKNTRISSSALVVGSQAMFSNSNPYRVGSMEYVALQPPIKKGDVSAGIKSKLDSNPIHAQIALNKTNRNTIAWKKNVEASSEVGNGQTSKPQANGTKLLATLHSLVGVAASKATGGK